MRYAVTGAAGFIGSHLAGGLLATGHDVVGFDCFTDYYDPQLKERERARISTSAESTWPKTSSTSPVSTASSTSPASPACAASATSSRSIFDATSSPRSACSRRRRAIASGWSSRRRRRCTGLADRFPTPEDATPHPLSPYGVTKLACELLLDAYVRSYDLDAVVLRYFNAFGPRQRPDMAFTRIAFALAGGATFDLFGDGTQSRSWTYVGDVVSATIRAMEAGTGTYNVGGALEASMNEAIALFERLAGKQLDVRRGEAVAGDQRRTVADTTRIRTELGWEPAVDLESGLASQWEWASATVAAR